MREECCAECRFFLLNDRNDDTGQCRRYPPQLCSVFYEVRGIDVDEDTGRSNVRPGEARFPEMGHEEWCGEYQPATVVLNENAESTAFDFHTLGGDQ